MNVIENEINTSGYDLFGQLTVVKDSSRKITIEEDDARAKLVGEVCLGTFKLAQGEHPKYSHQDLLGNAIDITCEINGMKIGYNETTYKNLISLAIRFLDIDYFEKYVDYQFIAKHIFDWVVDLYDKNRAEYNLYTYIQNEVEKELNDYTYFFKVQDLIIEEEFVVGNCTFTFKKSDYFESIFDEMLVDSKNLKPENKAGFVDAHKSFLNKVLVCSTVRGVKAKAELIIKKEVELSINAIKCLLINESLHPRTELFNVDYLYMNQTMSNYFSTTTSAKDFCMHLESKNSPTPITIDKFRFQELTQAGLETFNYFLLHKKNSELYYRTELQINLLGEINSTMDLYLRVTKLISFFENMIIPFDNYTAKGKTYMKNIISIIVAPNDQQKITKSVFNLYDIRDKYLHNRNQLPIDHLDLLNVKVLAVLFLLVIVDLNKELNTMEEMQLQFGIQNKVKQK